MAGSADEKCVGETLLSTQKYLAVRSVVTVYGYTVTVHGSLTLRFTGSRV